MRLRKPCRETGCVALAEPGSGYCAKHKPLEIRHNDYTPMYANRQWRELRKQVLLDQITCEICGNEASEVDHIQPHRGDQALFWDRNNLQCLCKSCHSSKTMREINARKSTQKQ